MWNMAKGTLPEEMLQSYKDFLANNSMAQMGGSSRDFLKMGEYTIEDQSIPPDAPYPSTFTFKAIEHSPPLAVFSVNYAR